MNMPPQHLPDWQSDISLLEAFSHVKLIIADLDGTFVRSSTSELTRSLRELHRSLTYFKYQVSLTIATGRAGHGAQPIANALSIPKCMPLIFYNGALIIEQGTSRVIQQSAISKQAVHDVYKLSEVLSLTMYSYWFNDPMTSALQELPAEQVFGFGRTQALDFNGLPVLPWHLMPANLQGCVAILIETEGANVQKIVNYLGNIIGVSWTSSGNRYIEIRPTGANKGVALEAVMRHLGLLRHHVLALGDADNDSEMLQVAGIGVAVRGASQLARNNSDFECKYGSVEGAVEILRLVKHAKRFYSESKGQEST